MTYQAGAISGLPTFGADRDGWVLVLAIRGVAIALALWSACGEYSGTWLNLKLTARWSFVVFLAVYVARPAHLLWRTAFTRQLLAVLQLRG